MKNNPKKTPWQKAWHFLWHEDSAASWIVNIILAFVLIKFLIYPAIGIVFGTQFPVVAVVSESMEHNQNLDSWWSENAEFYIENSITKEEFSNFPLKNGFNKGDIMVLIGQPSNKIQLGDVIVFQSGKSYPIIHRVIAVENDHFETKGDNNPAQIRDSQLDETNVAFQTLYGKAVVRIPYLGYVKIWAVKLLDLVGAGGLLG